MTVASRVLSAAPAELIPDWSWARSAPSPTASIPSPCRGRVYCWADATTAPIVPGDLLTTSNVPGHAMRANDAQMIHGAVIGKAMSPLSEGRGLVLVLIRPQ